MGIYQLLTEKDNTLIYNYITEKGIRKNMYIGNQKYLGFWAENKENLAKLLGNELIVKIPVDTLSAEVIKTVNERMRIDIVTRYMNSEIGRLIKTEVFRHYLDSEIGCINFRYLYENNSLEEDCVYLDKKNNSKILAKGTKFAKVVKFLIRHFNIEVDKEELEAAITEQSLLFNQCAKGNLCISIHPLDFMTMSDNANHWSSCMKWLYDEDEDGGMDRGCYCHGTVEMMNSKYVVCAYLENPEKTYQFKTDIPSEEADNYTWNSKAWRELFVVSEDMICSGKAYPYRNENLSKYILGILRQWAKERLGWTYKSIKDYNLCTSSIKIDTNGMYNDWYNDTCTTYYCYMKNDEEATTATRWFNISGPSVCLCCGKEVISKIEDSGPKENPCDFCEYADQCTTECEDYINYIDEDEMDYNDRFDFVNELICDDCRYDNNMYSIDTQLGRVKDYMYIPSGCTEPRAAFHNLTANHCSCCGKPYIINESEQYYVLGLNLYGNEIARVINICPDCIAKLEDKFHFTGHYDIKERFYGIFKILTDAIDIEALAKELEFPDEINNRNCYAYSRFENQYSKEEYYKYIAKQSNAIALYSPEEYNKYLNDVDYEPVNLLAELPKK